jgi:TgpA N-terminal domain/Transglutaminase-like superfamily
MSRLLPTRADLVDLTVVAGLTLFALLGFTNTYAGRSFLVIGAVGLGLGLIVSHVLSALRQPVVVLAAAVVVVFFAAGDVLVLSDEPSLSLATVRELAAASVYGWKELLTTLPPVAADGGLLVVPFILGLVGGAAGLALAQRVGRAGAPIAAPGLVLVLVLAFGTQEPGAVLLDGVVFAAVCLGWTALRRRRTTAGRVGRRQLVRALAAGLVLAVAAGAAGLAGSVIPGASANRTVLRDHITPPFDLGAYPSPLVGFRKYSKDANQLWDQPLFTVTGLPAGIPLRIATLDDYDGSVWGATHAAGFQRIGARIGPPDAGPLTTVRVTIAPAFASANDINAWLPGAGTLSRVEFGGARARQLGASLRYNRDLSAGIVTARLQAGDSYTLRTVLADPTLPADPQPFARPELTDGAQALLSSRVAAWTKSTVGLTAQLNAVASYLRTSGAFSDGGPGESQYLPGHSTGRLAAFLNGSRPVGDDEQYAAAYSLVANYLGIPARIVLGAVPGAGGVVRGSDVHAWVELHVSTGDWVRVPQTQFMPDPSKRPDQQPPQDVVDDNAAVVPPPNAVHLPTSPLDTSRVDPPPPVPSPSGFWAWLLAIILAGVVWVAPPLVVAALFVAVILGAKAHRRRRRRTRGSYANRYAAGWRELVDRARDLGLTVPGGHTRREEAELLRAYPVADLAGAADQVIYGPDDPEPAHVAVYWQQVEKARREMLRDLGRLRRVRAALSIRSLRRAGRGRRPALGGGTA